VKYDLAFERILNLPFPELDVKLNELELNTATTLTDIARWSKHSRRIAMWLPNNVVTISGGTSMANHLAMAALLEHGDEVPDRATTYATLLAIAEYLGAKIKRFPEDSKTFSRSTSLSSKNKSLRGHA